MKLYLMKMLGLLNSHCILATMVFVNLQTDNMVQTGKVEGSINNLKLQESLNSSDLISNRGYTIDDCTCVCGKSNENEHGGIVGGEPAVPAEFPWVVALLKNKERFFCAGTLITRYHVMTAAHCLENLTPEDITIILGEYDRENPMELNTEIRNLVDAVQHKDFDLTSFDNDIAILELDSSVNFTPNIRAACLPNAGDDQHYTGKRAIAAGWGLISETGDFSNVLRKVALPILDKKTCDHLVGENQITDNMICAGYPEGKKDACKGDSGGPIHLDGKVIGIVSWGDGCARPNRPGVFTKVTNYLKWIKNHIGEQCLCPPSGRGRS